MRVMMLSREIRRVPMDYDPPHRDRHGYQPVFDRFYDDALAEASMSESTLRPLITPRG